MTPTEHVTRPRVEGERETEILQATLEVPFVRCHARQRVGHAVPARIAALLRARLRMSGRSGSLIPAHLNYIQQQHRYDRQTRKAGMKKLHGLRHAYAQRRYWQLTGWNCPARGGPASKSLSPAQQAIDAEAGRRTLIKVVDAAPRQIPAPEAVTMSLATGRSTIALPVRPPPPTSAPSRRQAGPTPWPRPAPKVASRPPRTPSKRL